MARRRGLTAAMRDALAFEMARDSRIIYMGVDAHLGVWGYGRGLVDQFGPERVRTTPITEYAVTGAGAGAAMTGLRPIIDLHFANFMYAAWDQIADQIAKLPYMTNGLVSLPMLLIAAAGASGNAGQHSDVPTAALVNLGGICVCYVTTPEDAAGLIATSLRGDTPVVMLYPGAMGSERGDEFTLGEPVPMGAARVRREGRDLTCWASGRMVKRALEAAADLEPKGVSLEVIDPRSLNPLDTETVLASVQKTGRFVAVDEAHRSASVASEMVARVASSAWGALDAPPRVIAAPDNVTIPYSPVLEAEIIPSLHRISAECLDVVNGRQVKNV